MCFPTKQTQTKVQNMCGHSWLKKKMSRFGLSGLSEDRAELTAFLPRPELPLRALSGFSLRKRPALRAVSSDAELKILPCQPACCPSAADGRWSRQFPRIKGGWEPSATLVQYWPKPCFLLIFNFHHAFWWWDFLISYKTENYFHKPAASEFWVR